jgi:hypothetical protein
MTTLFFNSGRKHFVTTAEIVGKITGVTRLQAQVMGAIDIHQRHALVDVASEQAPIIIKKMTGIRIRGHALKVALWRRRGQDEGVSCACRPLRGKFAFRRPDRDIPDR